MPIFDSPIIQEDIINTPAGMEEIFTHIFDNVETEKQFYFLAARALNRYEDDKHASSDAMYEFIEVMAKKVLEKKQPPILRKQAC